MKLIALFAAALLPVFHSGRAAPVDIFAEYYFPPELLEAARDEVGLPDELYQKARAHFSETGPRLQELEEKVKRERKVLAELSKAARADQEALLAQLDKLHAAEGELKRLQLTTLATIKNFLSPEQQEQLREWKRKHSGQPNHEQRVKLQQRLESKVQRVQAAVAEWQNQGRDPSPVAAMMQEFSRLMENGRPQQAETVLDNALNKLQEQE